MVETFVKAKPFVEDPHYPEKRKQALRKLNFHDIDTPILDIIRAYAAIPHCFSLQSCYGHFIHKGQKDRNNVEPLSSHDENSKIKYRIAYIVFCIQNNDSGRELYNDLKTIAKIDPHCIQFGSCDWFWNRGDINSYILQVEPERYKTKDYVFVDLDEALHLQKVKNKMFESLRKILQKHQQVTSK